ncbi:MAG: putative toxin-antitoxin system toxin component, PIN family [Nanoarchaeota archaeon]|nr:putative toxin-antitoxin system toxin component, PIN family [Nanoarchaeota archaeon]MBU1632724.1 putative toxin-antitoxin system toxin component, PIN family [Nanoarchaeota archaeon]MBU1876269.1 putative toxin-antitoxin system toxin component, PIN family [Nanoarchaeota archaeon]
MVVTFDTNAILSATLWDGSVAQKLLHDLIMQNVKIYSSLEILDEYQKVLKRDFDFSDEDVAEIMEKVLAFVTLVKLSMKVDVVKEDADDNIIIECALESNSKYIITYDPHLLKLKEYNGIQIIKPEIARAIF